MIDAATGKTLETIFTFQRKIIDKKNIATNNVNFVVFPNSSAVKSVYMALQGPVSSFEKFVQPSHIQIENVAPHAMFGDIGGAFNGKSLQTGLYRITATPYAGENGTGNGGFGRIFEFEIIDTSFMLRTPALTVEDSSNFTIYPNPATGSTTLQAKDKQRIQRTVVFDIFGKKAREYLGSAGPQNTIDLSGLVQGLYFVQIQTDQGMETRKLVVK
jgi:hypothetical protein